jgi:deoxyhypusine synthase
MKKKAPSRKGKEKYLAGKRILPKPISAKTDVVQLIDNLDAYNGGRLRAACQLLKDKYSHDDVTVGMTPAGMGPSAVIPLMNHGFVDWMVATGANMYHDLHFAFNLPMHRGSPSVDDADLREKGVTRIYDILFDYEDVLMETDRRLRRILVRPEFQKEMGTRELYHHLGKVMDEYERKNGLSQVSILAAAYRNGIPVFTSSPGDSTIGMNVAGLELLAEASGLGHLFKLKTAVILIGGGSPKNFMLQTEPQIQEVLMIPEVGQDYDINVTDARPDTGGLSGAPPSEAASWGKIDPDKLEETVTAYLDVTVALPFMAAYVMRTTKPKKLKRLYDRGEELHRKLIESYLENNKEVDDLRKRIRHLSAS